MYKHPIEFETYGEVLKEINRLRAENEALQITLDAVSGQLEELEKRTWVLRLDSRRYRWLREDETRMEEMVRRIEDSDIETSADLDAAIDAALRGEGEK